MEIRNTFTVPPTKSSSSVKGAATKNDERKIFEDHKSHILKLKVSKCTYIVLALIPMYGNPNYRVLSLNRVTSVGPRTVKISRV